jgi:thiosulfate/3-mercaptopyruvate sulfurtransferase
MPWLINATQLEKFRKSQKNVVVFDASWHLPGEDRDAKAEFAEQHILGARFLDLDVFHDKKTSLPNMLVRDPELIASLLGEHGITNDHKIIFYDRSKLHTSCRALWMMKVFGHNPFQLYVLDGGLNAWERFGGKLETGEHRLIAPRQYVVNYQSAYIRSLAQMKAIVSGTQEQVIDMRHPVRYAGGPGERPGVRTGHMPGSICFPYFTMFDNDGNWKPLDKIRKQLVGLSVDLKQPINTTCGSGMTAPILNFVLDLMEQSPNAVYDGSWSEWAAETLYSGETNISERPVETCLE